MLTTFDSDGNVVEIDRREVQDAWLDITVRESPIIVIRRAAGTIHLDLETRENVERWLGYRLESRRMVTVSDEHSVARETINVKSAGPIPGPEQPAEVHSLMSDILAHARRGDIRGNVITSGNMDFTETDAQARAIMHRLAAQGVTEETVARTPYGILVNMVLNALWETIDQDMKAESADRPAPSNENAISAYLHCGRCVAEFETGQAPDGESMATWARFSLGWTPLGLQVWCERHECNVVHIDFEGERHPANTTARSDA